MMAFKHWSLLLLVPTWMGLAAEPHEEHYQKLMTGTAAAIADVLCTHPLWVAKTLAQQGKIHSAQDMARLVVQKPGILYAGVAANAATMLPLTTSRVFVASLLHEHMGEHPGVGLEIMASFSSGVFSALFSAPTEAIRTGQLQAKRSGTGPQGFYGVTQRLVEKEGLRSLTTGMTAVALRDGMYTAAFVSAAPLLKEELKERGFSDTSATFMAYGSVSLAASFGNHPFDTIKTLQQTALAERVFKEVPTDSSLKSACEQILVKYGPGGFFKGYSPRGVRFMIGLFVKAATIEQLDDLWRQYNENPPAFEEEED